MIHRKMMMLDILKHETGAKAGNRRHVGPDSHDFQAFLHPVQGFCRGEARNKTWPEHGNRKGWFVTSIPNDPNVFVKLRWTICSAHFDSHSPWILAHECAWLTPRSSVRKRRFKHMFAASWSGSCSPPSQGIAVIQWFNRLFNPTPGSRYRNDFNAVLPCFKWAVFGKKNTWSTG